MSDFSILGGKCEPTVNLQNVSKSYNSFIYAIDTEQLESSDNTITVMKASHGGQVGYPRRNRRETC